MGAIWFDNNRLIPFLSEIIGYKTGLALTKDNFLKIIPDYNQLKTILLENDHMRVRVRSETIQELVQLLMHNLGNTDSPTLDGIIELAIKCSKDPIHTEILQDVVMSLNDLIDKTPDNHSIDPTSAMQEINQKYGLDGVNIFHEYVEAQQAQLHADPWCQYRFIEWKDIVELNDLFKSESLNPSHGKFIDQRFIDYLNHNFSEIDKIHWRKFEQLVAEYFHKMNWKVEIGSGRNDGGIDIRVWSPNNSGGEPTLILIQCKRTKSKVGKVVVKALWADVVNESATSGLIVTTTSLSPGAMKICQARAYDIEEADRKSLKEWLNKMRSPGNGIFMGE